MISYAYLFPVELRHLRYFAAVAEELHFRRAANRLHITQPALSQQIRNLENELDVRLFARTKRRVELTHAGHAFLVEAQQILSRAESAAWVAKRADRGEIGPLKLACGTIATDVILPLILQCYRARFPEVQISLKEGLTAEVVSALEEGTADVGILLPYFHSKVLKLQTVLRIPILAALPEFHPLARVGPISLKQLANEPFILFPHRRGSGFYEHAVGICLKAGFMPKLLEGAEHFHTLLILVRAGYGVSLVPAMLSGIATRKIAFAELKEPYATVAISMAWRINDPSPQVTAFLQTVRACCRDVTREAATQLAKPK